MADSQWIAEDQSLKALLNTVQELIAEHGEEMRVEFNFGEGEGYCQVRLVEHWYNQLLIDIRNEKVKLEGAPYAIQLPLKTIKAIREHTGITGTKMIKIDGIKVVSGDTGKKAFRIATFL